MPDKKVTKKEFHDVINECLEFCREVSVFLDPGKESKENETRISMLSELMELIETKEVGEK